MYTFLLYYSNVLPMDSNRVKLSLEHGESDYINAIYYDSYRQSKAFILTQTPMHVCLTSLYMYVSLAILTYTVHNTVHVLYITINECNVSVLSKNVLLLSTLNFTISVNSKIFFSQQEISSQFQYMYMRTKIN